MIKMLVLDIDGTIYRKDFTASENVKTAIKQLVQKGIKVVLATGRMYAATIRVAQELELNTPLICHQGGLIKEFCNGDTVLHQKDLNPIFAKEIIQVLKKKNIHFNLYMNDTLIVENDSEIIRQYTDERKIEYKVVNNVEDLNLQNINKILAIDTDTVLIDNLTKELQLNYGKDLYIIKSMPMFCEVSNKEATKGNAIRHLAKLWEIRENEIMAIGDQDNDIEMLLSAGIKVAMGNATVGLKNVADYITGSVDEDGVVTAINKYMQ